MEKSFQINSPFISIVIGEGGSGGAIAIASSDYVLMLEHSIYSVISPEGCASILWKSDQKSDISTASEAQKLTSADLLSMKIIDSIIEEPIGGAHRNKRETIENVDKAISKFLDKSIAMSINDRKVFRRNRFNNIGNQFVI